MTESIKYKTWSVLGVPLCLCVSLFVFLFVSLFVFLAPPVYASGPMCKKLPPANWSRDYIEDFLTKVVWHMPKWKTTKSNRYFRRWYSSDTKFTDLLFNGRVFNNELVNDGFVVFELIPPTINGKDISSLYFEEMQKYVEVLNGYTGLKVFLYDSTRKHDNKYRKYSINGYLYYFPNYQKLIKSAHMKKQFYRVGYGNFYKFFIEKKGYIDSDNRNFGIEFDSRYIVSNLSTFDLADFKSLREAYYKTLYTEMMDNITNLESKSTHKSLLTNNYDVLGRGEVLQLSRLDKYLLCAYYSPNIQFGVVSSKQKVTSITNEIMRLQRENTNFFDRFIFKITKLFT